MTEDILKQLQNAKTAKEKEWLVVQFSLSGLSPLLQNAVWVAAVPHWFDVDFLNALLETPLDESDFQTLTRLSFIEIFPDRGYNVHELTRNILLEKLWTEKPDRHREISRLAAD